MAREHFFTDQAQIIRAVKKVTHGEVSTLPPAPVGSPIACILTNISGKEDAEPARTYLPETALLKLLPVNTAGSSYVLRQGDTLQISYRQNGTLVAKPKMYKVVSDVVMNRRHSEIVSFTVEVRMDTEN